MTHWLDGSAPGVVQVSVLLTERLEQELVDPAFCRAAWALFEAPAWPPSVVS